ncbi:PCP reductase family protein [Candidatus Poribacteria bacterium]|nr:PCP reductase family protein [Candidatus Poribacteria bacterium]
MSTENKVEARLSAVEDRLNRLENLLIGISEKLDRKPQPASLESESAASAIDEEKAEALKHWVTDYVSMRLQQLVPETCDHPTTETQAGPFLGNTSIRCTEEVVHRVKRIPIPFVREMVVQRVADNARRANVDVVDVEFFEKAATF